MELQAVKLSRQWGPATAYLYQDWRAGNYAPQCGEIWSEIRSRVCQAVTAAALQVKDTLLFVCHAGVIRAMLNGLIGLPPVRLLPVGQASLTVLAFRDGPAKLEAVNVRGEGLSLDAPD